MKPFTTRMCFTTFLFYKKNIRIFTSIIIINNILTGKIVKLMEEVKILIKTLHDQRNRIESLNVCAFGHNISFRINIYFR